MVRFLFDDFVFVAKRDEMRKFLTKEGYLKTTSSRNCPYFIKFFVDETGSSTVDLNFESIKQLAVKEMNKLKPFIESLLTKK